MKITGNPNMTTFLVSTIARYVLVETTHEGNARKLGLPLLEDLYRQDGHRTDLIRIDAVREATDSEIELWNWHHEMLEKERGNEQ